MSDKPPRRAAFLDRDGVVNRDRGYVHRWSEFEFVPGALNAVRRLKAAGYVLVIVTNQAGIAHGMYTEQQYQKLTRRMLEHMAAAGALIDAVYHCPHHPQGIMPALAIDCHCRKPAPGLLLRAAADLGLCLADSFLVGDKPSDLAAARNAGVGRAFAVRSDNPESADRLSGADACYPDLAACVEGVLAE